MGSFQDLDGVPLFKSITKWSALVETTSSLPACLERAATIAVDGRPGPVYLDLPEDVLTGLAVSTEHESSNQNTSLALDLNAIREAASLLLAARRPALIVGKGIRWSEPYDEINRLVNDYAIPFVTSPMGRGYLPDDHPLCFNQARSALMRQADVVLLVGARLDWSFRFGTEFAANLKLIQIDIEPLEIGVNKAAAVGIVGDAKQVLRRILAEMYDAGRGTISDLGTWHASLAEEREKNRRRLESLMSSDTLPMTPYRMLKEIGECLSRDAVCILDGNIFMAAAQQVLSAYLPASRMTAGGNGCLGVGIPFGIGAKLALPERPVVVITGDAAFGFNCMEMETAVRHGIPIVIVVVNNEGNCGALMQKAFFPEDSERVTVYQPDIQYQQIIGAFGGHAEFVDRPEQLQTALQRGLASGKAACVNVRVDPFAPYPTD
jgi:thiamine pyrophosphate-dependent acetolactate synthase large subunit-like protein